MGEGKKENWETLFNIYFCGGSDGTELDINDLISEEIKSFIRQLLQEERKKLLGEIRKWIEQEKMGIDINKGTWGGEIEKVFPSMESFLDELEKFLSTLTQKK